MNKFPQIYFILSKKMQISEVKTYSAQHRQHTCDFYKSYENANNMHAYSANLTDVI